MKTQIINDELYYYDEFKQTWKPYIGSLMEKLDYEMEMEKGKEHVED